MAAVKITSANTNRIDECHRPVVRTSTGDLYAVIIDDSDNDIEVWYSSDGTSWEEKDAANSPEISSTAFDVAIDSNDILHISYSHNGDAYYVTFDTLDGGDQDDAFNTPAMISSPTGTCVWATIALDSNDVPHVAYGESITGKDTYDTVWYLNKVGGSWNTRVEVEGVSNTKECYRPAIVVNGSDIPIVIYINGDDGDLGRGVGNQNNATSFTLTDLDTTITAATQVSACVDGDGDIWGAVEDSDSSMIAYEGTTARDSGNDGYNPSMVTIGSNTYLFYETGTGDDIAYDVWNGSSWAGETVLEDGIFQNAKAKWSYNNDNQRTTQIDYLFSDGTDIYWNKIDLEVAGTNIEVNISDAWKDVSGLQINIGDSWKTVTGVQINIGDSWKTVF